VGRARAGRTAERSTAVFRGRFGFELFGEDPERREQLIAAAGTKPVERPLQGSDPPASMLRDDDPVLIRDAEDRPSAIVVILPTLQEPRSIQLVGEQTRCGGSQPHARRKLAHSQALLQREHQKQWQVPRAKHTRISHQLHKSSCRPAAHPDRAQQVEQLQCPLVDQRQGWFPLVFRHRTAGTIMLNFKTIEAARFTWRQRRRRMSAFTEKEVEYLRGQRLARLATVGKDSSPHVVPVGFRVDADSGAIEVGGHGLSRSKKWRDLQANSKVALVIDDLASTQPWTPRGIEIRGRAELHDEGGNKFGPGWDRAWLRILPQRIVSWGINGPAFSDEGRSARTVGES
jgi:pyridoxamine 5'-phosphate oxidase family protein